MLSSQFSNIRRTGFDQSSPVHPVSESRGGGLSVTHGRTDGRTKEILLSNFYRKSEKISKNLKTLIFFILFIFLNFFFFAEKKKKMLSSQFSNIRRMGFDQSSPVQPVSESRGGSLSATDGRTKEILLSNLGYENIKQRPGI